MLLDTLTVKLVGDGSSLQSSLKSAEGSLGGFQSAANKAGGALSTWGSSMLQGVGGVFRAAGGLAVGAVGTAVAASTSTIMGELNAGIARADIINNYPKMMANLGVSNDAAAASIDRIKEGLDGLPTTTDSAASAVARFTSKNKDIGTSTDYFLALNNAILAGGAPTQIQENALEQLSQAYSKGTIDVMEWRALQTAMPGQLSQVAQAFGMTEDALYSSLKSGETTMDDFMGKIVELNETGTGEFLSFSEQARNATGGFQTQMANMRTAIARGWEGALNAFGSDRFTLVIGVLRSGINSLFEFITPIFARIGDAAEALFGEGGVFDRGADGMPSRFDRMISPLSEFSNTFDTAGAGIATILTNLAPLVGLLAGAFGGLLGNLPLIGGLFQGLNPIFGATIGLFVGMIANSENLRNALGGAASGIMEAFAPMAQQIGPLLQGIVSTIGSVLGTLGDALAPVVTAIAQVIAQLAPVFMTIVDLVTTSVLPMIEQIVQLAIPIGEMIGQIVGALGTALVPIIETVVGIIEQLMPSIQMIIDLVSTSIMPAIMGVVESLLPLIGVIGNVINIVIGALAPVFQALVEIFGIVIAAVQPIIEAFNRVVDALMPIVTSILGNVGPAFQFLASVVTGVLNFIMPLIEGALDIIIGVVDGVATAVEWVAGVVGPPLDAIGGFFRDTFGGAAEDTEDAMGRVESSVGSATDAISQSTGSNLGQVETSWDSVLGNVESNTGTFAANQTSNFDELFGNLNITAGSGMGEINSTLSGGFVDVEGVVIDSGSNADGSWMDSMTSLEGTTKTGVDNVTSTVDQLPSAIQGSFSGAGGWLVPAGSDIMQGLINGINSQRGALMATMSSIAASIKSATEAAMEIGSPSKVFYRYGRWTIEGFINGAYSLSKNAKDVIHNIFVDIAQDARSTIDQSMEGNRRQLNQELKELEGVSKHLDTLQSRYAAEQRRIQAELQHDLAVHQGKMAEIRSRQADQKEIDKWIKDEQQVYKDHIKMERDASDKVLDNLQKSMDDAAKRYEDVYKRSRDRIDRLMEDMQKTNESIATSLSQALSGDLDGVTNTLNELYSTIGTKGTKAVQSLGNQLLNLTARFGIISDRLDAANAKLDDARKAMSSYAESVANTFATQTREVPEYTSAQDYLGNLQSRLASARQFSSKIKELAALGMPQVIIDDILSMGITDGLKAATSLLTGMDAQTVRDIINTHNDIDRVSQSLGSNLSKNYYQAGVDAAKGIVDGLESQQKRIEEAMQRVSDSMVKAIKKALGIKSPSRVFIDLMGQVMDGAVVGITNGTQALIDSMGVAVTDMIDIAQEHVPELDVGVNPNIMDWMDGTRTLPTDQGALGDDSKPYVINITVNAESSDPAEIARAIEKSIVRSLPLS